jgi:hypothetical protein
VHIKFLDHGKGSPAKASAYLLDKLDHLGNVRAGIEVLKGDATTFNAICDSSPHLWKYTSGVIAWSKNDVPTDDQIKEVLDDFEKHAFAGLEQSQYHLFAVLHTDDDGSKHIHVLTPRIDLESGKSLNIAPPGHEKHFDSLRDFFNTKYQWSRPDDLFLMQTTQEPNHIAKLNAQAKNILSSQELENLPKKQFCQAMDNYVRTLLKTQTAANRADIVACINELDGIDSIKTSKEFLTVTLNNGKKHRLKGDFYHEKFEIESYSEHLRAAAESRPSANELAAALTDADQLRATYWAKRAAYHHQHYAFAPSTADNNSHKVAFKLDFDRDRKSITPRDKNAHNELYGANTSITSTAIEYRYIKHQNRHNEHRFVFNIHAVTTKPHQQPSPEPQDQSRESAAEYPKPSPTSDSKAKRADREQHTNTDHGQIEYPEIKIHSWGDGGNCRKINSINQQLERLETRVAEIRLKPKPATNFSYLRSDGYYPDYVAYHKELSDKQQKAYENKKPLQLIDYIQKKSENLETYMRRASANLNKWDYEKFEEIIKNDQQMLKYLQCEKILEPQNDHLEQQRTSYQACLKSFENIKSHIYEIKNPSPERNVPQQAYEHKPKPKNDFDLDI